MYGRDNTFGGYATTKVVSEDFVLKIPAALDPRQAAPIEASSLAFAARMNSRASSALRRLPSLKAEV